MHDWILFTSPPHPTPPHPLLMSDIIELLLAHGAKVNEKNGFGWNSLDEAVCYGDKPTSKWGMIQWCLSAA